MREEFWMVQSTVRSVGGIQLGFYGVHVEHGLLSVRIIARPDPEIFGVPAGPASPVSVPLDKRFCVEGIGCIEVVDAIPASSGLRARGLFRFLPAGVQESSW